MKTFDIYGDIVDNDSYKMSPEDVCPLDFKAFLSEVGEDDILININSAGGSVMAGISIANMILAANKKCKTIAKVEGYACSIASVIACACSELHMNDSSFLMIHQVWGNVCGNADELRKEADIMQKMTDSLLTFYHMKFDLSDEQLLDYIKAETWISGAAAEQFKLNVMKTDEKIEYKYAAKLRKFNKCPIIEEINMDKEKEITEEIKQPVEEEVAVEEVKEQEQVEEVKSEEAIEEIKEEIAEELVEEKKPEEVIEELKKEIEKLTSELDTYKKELAECKPDMTADERVAKCQSVFQNKINHFKDELKAKDEELQKFKDSVSSLTSQLEESKKELHDMSAAFEEKEVALEKLNSGVLSPSEEIDWKSLKGKEFFDYLKKNPQITR